MKRGHRPSCRAAHARLLVITVIAGDHTTDQDPDFYHGVDLRFAELCGEPDGDLLRAGVKGEWDVAPAGALHAEVPGGRLALVCGDSLQQLIVDLVHLVRYHYTDDTQTALVADTTELRWTDIMETSVTDQRLTDDGRVGQMPIHGVRFL